MARRSGGAFDVTIGPLVALWRGARKTGLIPDPAQIQRAKRLVGWKKLRLDAREIALLRGGMGKDEEALPLTWAQVREMEESGIVSFGAHTMHHPILGYLADPEEVQQEVRECRTLLEQHLGHPVRTFAYPFGKPEHIPKEGLQAVQEAGYQWAVTTIEEVNNPQTNPYLLRRLPGELTEHWLVVAAELAGVLGIVSRLRKKILGMNLGSQQAEK